jgi:hypothetical protein
MKSIEQLKELNINDCTVEQLNEIKNDVIHQSDEQIKEYLEFILDEQVPVLEDNENWNENIDTFLRSSEFKPYFIKIREENDIESEKETVRAGDIGKESGVEPTKE